MYITNVGYGVSSIEAVKKIGHPSRAVEQATGHLQWIAATVVARSGHCFRRPDSRHSKEGKAIEEIEERYHIGCRNRFSWLEMRNMPTVRQFNADSKGRREHRPTGYGPRFHVRKISPKLLVFVKCLVRRPRIIPHVDGRFVQLKKPFTGRAILQKLVRKYELEFPKSDELFKHEKASPKADLAETSSALKIDSRTLKTRKADAVTSWFKALLASLNESSSRIGVTCPRISMMNYRGERVHGRAAPEKDTAGWKMTPMTVVSKAEN
ncbi:hypothetical protein C8J56DRAFT_895401 [Mycena floridula]|nr:hypothetical protein C8J56DRAFT_895401 [Mycena floridula]